jgi:hypothetical protein
VPDAGAELWSAVEDHPTQLTQDGEERLRRLVSEAAGRLAAEPERSDEAIANLRLVLDRAAEMTEKGEEDTDLAVLDVTVTEESVEMALRDLCPIFPFC